MQLWLRLDAVVSWNPPHHPTTNFQPYLLQHIGFHGRSHFGLFIAIDHLLPGTYRGHMPKFVLKSQKLNERLRFENFEIMRFFPFVYT